MTSWTVMQNPRLRQVKLVLREDDVGTRPAFATASLSPEEAEEIGKALIGAARTAREGT